MTIIPVTPIVQFGTSRFLQAHVDLFVSEALATGQAAGPITIVQSTASSDRAGRLAAFNGGGGFPVRIRGIEDGRPVDREVRVTSVVRGLSAQGDWAEVTRVVVEEARFIVSNTADAGFRVDDRRPLDLTRDASDPPPSFPQKLLVLLAARHRAGRDGLVILPCELINRNGSFLHALVMDLARESAADVDFMAWLDRDCRWVNSLVDRIVSSPIEPAGAVAEPYALWAIEARPGLDVPCVHPAVRLVENLDEAEFLKLYILNLGHTALADLWRREAWPADTTVRGLLSEPAVRAYLHGLYENEVLPGFAAHGLGRQAADYVAATLERFDNPYLNHRLRDIANDHSAKVERRICAFLAWSKDADLSQPILNGIVSRM